MIQNYTGFVYLWFDSTKKMFYLGSHTGTVDDGYIGSGIRFLRAYKTRPDSFKRKILEYINGDKEYLFKQEQKWLDLIKDEELHTKYYNQKKCASGGSVKGRKQPKTAEHIQKLRKPRVNISKMKWPKSQETKRKISEAMKGVDRAGSLNGMYGKTHTEESKKLLSEKAKNRSKITCSYCNKEVLSCHLRYHRD